MYRWSARCIIADTQIARDLDSVGFSRDRPIDEFSLAVEELSDYDAEMMLQRRERNQRLRIKAREKHEQEERARLFYWRQ
jgi:hypothetical protein